MIKQHKAFTLVELMVAMAIIAVLIGLAAFGINTLQRLSRDNQRRQIVQNLQVYIEGYYNDYLEYPDQTGITVTRDTIAITDYLDGPSLAGAVRVSNDASNVEGTVYCYKSTDDGYILGALLEGGNGTQFFNAGTSQTDFCALDRPTGLLSVQ